MAVRSDRPEPADPVPRRHLGYKQTRSLKTFEALLAAAETLVHEQAFEDLQVDEIAERAGVSVGTFYRRFENKDGLLHVLHERLMDRVAAWQTVMLDPSRWQDADIDELVRGVIDQIVETTKDNRGVLLASARRAAADAEFSRREGRVHQEFRALMARLLLLHADEIVSPNPRLAAEYCAYQMRAVLQYYLVTDDSLGDGQPDLTLEEMKKGLSMSILTYLRSPDA